MSMPSHNETSLSRSRASILYFEEYHCVKFCLCVKEKPDFKSFLKFQSIRTATD